MRSLSARLLAVVSLLFVVFFGLTILALEGSFRRAAERAVEDGLDVRLIMLLSAAQSDGELLTLPDPLPEPRFSTPGSGLFGQVTAGEDELVWRSPSAVGVFLPTSYLPTPGERRFRRLETSVGEDVFALSLAVSWERSDGDDVVYTFSVAESSAPFFAQVSRFRRQLLGSFAVLAALLLASQAIALRWVLRPLRQVEDEIGEIEGGERKELSADYPTELAGLTRNTNRLIRAERQRLARYRNTLGNLAHSLKTPLAVLRNTVTGGSADDRSAVVQAQIDRMNDIVGYQLQRAAAAGGVTLGQEPVPVLETVLAITDSLAKVYADKKLQCDVGGDEEARFLGDRGDLMEILGNVLDNAFKWCRSRVRVQIAARERQGGRRRGVCVTVEDDGDGIAREQREAVLARGARADQSVAGQGIGLAVVQELVELVEGELQLDSSELGGALVRIDI